MKFPIIFLNKKHIFLFTFSFVFFQINAQYTEVINSNRPGFSESPYSVGTGIYQLESSIFYRNIDPQRTFSRPQSLGADFLFRTSFFLDKLELNTQITYQRDELIFNNIFSSNVGNVNGLSKLAVAAKYLLYEQEFEDKSKIVRSWKKRMAFDYKRLIPSIAVYAGVNTNFIGDAFVRSGLSPKAGILLQNDLSTDLKIITNAYYDFIGTDSEEISYIITGTYNLDDYWSVFLENQGIFREATNEINLGAGVAYLWSRHLQVNGSARYILEGQANGFYGSIGVTYRLDRHRDKLKKTDPADDPNIQPDENNIGN